MKADHARVAGFTRYKAGLSGFANRVENATNTDIIDNVGDGGTAAEAEAHGIDKPAAKRKPPAAT